MPDIRTVLCPVDFSDLSRRELSLATEVCGALGARLVVHHNLAEIAPGLTRQWEWDQFHRAAFLSQDETDARLRALLASVPPDIAAEATVSRGPVGLVLLDMAARLPADLVVLGYHGLKDLDHASVTERMLDGCRAPLLTIHDGALTERFQLRGEAVPVVVPLDLSDASSTLAAYAFDLARQLPLELHLLHVMSSVTTKATAEAKEHALRALVPAELAARTTCHLARGNAVGQILETAERVRAGFMIMGEHTRGVLLSLFLKNNAQEILAKSVCPVWFVPRPR